MAGKKKIPEATPEEAVKAENRFSKEQLLSSERFRERRDMVEALLLPWKRYTVREVEERIERYRKGKVR